MGMPEDYVYSLREAFSLDVAAGEVQRLANSPSDLPPEQANQRKAILMIAYQLIYKERDKHLAKLREGLC